MTSWVSPESWAQGLMHSVGYAAIWHEPGVPRFEHGSPHAFATREILSAPVEQNTSDLQDWQTMRDSSFAVLADAALMPGVASFEIRYVATPRSSGVRIRMYLTTKVRDWHYEVAQTAVEAACRRLPRGFDAGPPGEPLVLGTTGGADDEVIVELRRDEELTRPQWEFVPSEFYYVINDAPGDGSGWSTFWRSLVSVRSPVTVSLLFQQSELHFLERDMLAGILTDLERYSHERSEYDFLGPVDYPADANARLAWESWEARLERLRRPLLARMAVRGEVSTAVEVATALATAIASTREPRAAHPMHLEPARGDADVRQAQFSFDWLEIVPWGGHPIWQDWEPQSLRRLPYLFGLDEAASLALLPVPDSQGVAGMPRTRDLHSRRQSVVDSTSTGDGPSEATVRIGRFLHEGQEGEDVSVALGSLTQHLLTVGSSGFGKTTLVQSLLTQLWRDHAVPFVVIEPYPRSEYRGLIQVPGMEAVQVLTIGDDRIGPLRFNPMAPPPGVRREVHEQAVLASLKVALPLFTPQDTILAQAIPLAYERAGWDEDTCVEDGIAPPTLRSLMSSYEQVFDEAGYVGEARNIGRGFATRLAGLLTGGKGRVLDTIFSHDVAALLTQPIVVELKNVADPEESAVFVSLLLDRIRQEAIRRGNSAGELRHVTVIEEAQQILGAGSHSGNQQGVNDPRASAVQSFANAVSTLRSFGEGIVMCTQRPSELHPQAIANTATRVVLHLEEASDRESILRSFDSSDELGRIAARLHRAEALARWPGRDEPEVVQIVAEPGVDSQVVVSDDELAVHMRHHRSTTTRLLPYRLCSLDVCLIGCDPARRRGGAAIAKRVSKQVEDVWIDARAGTADPILPTARLVAEQAPGDMPRAYCAATHLAVADVVVLDPERDHRPIMIAALRQVFSDE